MRDKPFFAAKKASVDARYMHTCAQGARRSHASVQPDECFSLESVGEGNGDEGEGEDTRKGTLLFDDDGDSGGEGCEGDGHGEGGSSTLSAF